MVGNYESLTPEGTMARMDLRQLRKDLTHIEAEVAKLQKKAQDFRGVIAFYEEAGEGAGPSKTPGKELDDTIVLILEAEGKPLHPKTVCERLGERGIKVPGQNPVSNVRAHMSGDERCVPTRKDGLWGLKVNPAVNPFNGNNSGRYEGVRPGESARL